MVYLPDSLKGATATGMKCTYTLRGHSFVAQTFEADDINKPKTNIQCVVKAAIRTQRARRQHEVV